MTSERLQEIRNQLEEYCQSYQKNGNPIPVNFRSMVPELNKPDRYTHLIHPYPAKLLASIPYYILSTDIFCPKGGLVLDPFCGSGTVLLEAIISGRNAIGADANPIARLISRAKTCNIDAVRLENELNKILHRVAKDRDAVIPEFPNRDYWFSQSVQRQLANLLAAIRRSKDSNVKTFFMVCFSSIIKKVSYADPNIYVPVKINPDRFADKPDIYQKLRIRIDSLRNIDVYDKFKKVVQENIERMKKLRDTESVRFSANIISMDARRLTTNLKSNDVLDNESVDMILTSPPYAGAQKYIRSSRLSLNWFDLGSVETIRALEKNNIGREDFAKKDMRIEDTGIRDADNLIKEIATKDRTRATIVSTYLKEMGEALRESVRVLKKGGYIVLIVGPNKVCGYKFDTPRYLRQIAENYGMHTELQLIDSIKKYGMLTIRNKNAGLIMVEHVIIMKK